VRRANMFSGEEGKKKRVYSSKYALSSICTCSKCGDIYRRIAWMNIIPLGSHQFPASEPPGNFFLESHLRHKI